MSSLVHVMRAVYFLRCSKGLGRTMPLVQYNNIYLYMNKLLDSDRLRAVQFKCNTSAKSVTPVRFTDLSGAPEARRAAKRSPIPI